MAASFGRFARTARVEKEIQLKEVAELLDFSSAYVSDIEKGNRLPPAEGKLRAWAEFIGVDADEFVWMAMLERPVELPPSGNPKQDRFAHALARRWPNLTDAEQDRLMNALDGAED